MPKDPAFLFYPKDWLQGTSSLMPDEKGVFIDLLAHQHQDKDLPNDTRRLARMCGMSENEFLIIWETLKNKFTITETNRLVNRKLTEITTERLTKSATNRVTGTFASVIKNSGLDWETKEKIKKEFKTEGFLTVSDRNLTERLTEWLAERLKTIGNGNGNINKGGAGGKRKYDKEIFGIEITPDKEYVVLSDGEKQRLGKSQRINAQHDSLDPKDVYKNYIV